MNEPVMREILAQVLPFWGDLDEANRDDLSRCSRLVSFCAGDFVQGAGGGCAGVVFVLEGTLRAYLLAESGREITLFRLKPGMCCVLAASCIMPMISVDITLAAQTDAAVLVIDPKCFSRVARKNVHVEAFMYRQSTERVSDVLRVMNRALFSDFNTRLADFLLEEVEGAPNGVLRMTHEEIARHVGSAREVVTRALKQLAVEGLVELSRGTVKVVDVARLRMIVESF